MSFLCSCQKPLELRIRISTPVPSSCMLQAGLLLENGLIQGSQVFWCLVPDSRQQWVCKGRGKSRVSRHWGSSSLRQLLAQIFSPGWGDFFFLL